MKKIYLDLSESIKSAIAFNLEAADAVGKYIICEDSSEADMHISYADFPEGKLRLGLVLDKIARDYGAIFSVENLLVNIKAQLVSLDDIEIKITEKEAALLAKLADQGGYVPRAEILQDVWGYADDVDTKTVESHVHRLNQKIEEAFGVKIIEHKNAGYRLISKP